MSVAVQLFFNKALICVSARQLTFAVISQSKAYLEQVSLLKFTNMVISKNDIFELSLLEVNISNAEK